MNVTDALEQVRKEIPMSKEIEYIISFIENSQEVSSDNKVFITLLHEKKVI